MPSIRKSRLKMLDTLVFVEILSFNEQGFYPTSHTLWRVLNERNNYGIETIQLSLNRLVKSREVFFFTFYAGKKVERGYMANSHAVKTQREFMGDGEVDSPNGQQRLF